MTSIRVGILGATGYTGLELTRILLRHPNVTLQSLFVRQAVGQTVESLYPHLPSSLVYESFSPEKLSNLDLLFLALPHGESHKLMAEISPYPVKVIDLSADFRLADQALYNKTYGQTHESASLLSEFVYGLPELFGAKLKKAKYCACPGCYPTSVILALHPLEKNGLLSGEIIVDSKSGVTGAGKTLKESFLFSEIDENVSAYGTYYHRHKTEMEYYLKRDVFFSPHLMPMKRGILSSIYVDNEQGMTQDEVDSIFQEFYKDSSFVRYIPGLGTPSTRHVAGSNRCIITAKVIQESSKVVVFSCIDNLLKGASGQAVQCMNIMFGLPEELGLPREGFYL